MDQTATLLTVKIREGKTGLFFATSDEEPTFFLSATSADDLWHAIPLALEYIFRARNLDVAAIPTDKGNFGQRPWAIVPRDLLNLANHRKANDENPRAA